MSLEDALNANTAATQALTAVLQAQLGHEAPAVLVAPAIPAAAPAAPRRGRPPKETPAAPAAPVAAPSAPLAPVAAPVVAAPAVASSVVVDAAFKHIADKLTELAMAKGRDVAVGLLAKLGASSVPSLGRASYPAFIAEADRLLGKVPVAAAPATGVSDLI